MWMERVREAQVAVLGLCLMVGLIVGTMILSMGMVEFRKSGDEVITVTGAASEILPSDFAQWQGSVSTRGATMAEAYGYLKKNVAIVTDYLREHGVPAKEISTQAVTTETVFAKNNEGYDTSDVRGYILRQTVRIESNNVDLVERVANSITELLTKDIVFEPGEPQYYYTKLDDIKIKMLARATENAKARASAMARSTGNAIGLMRSAHMGVFQITAKNSTDVSDSGILDTTTREKKVTAVVNVSFAVR